MGKTTARVAGNVKPSSSGRIRELLVNKHGAGSIITFSALSSNSGLPNSSDTNKNPPIEEKLDQTIEQQTPSKEKTRVVVKKVGGRDCFTKVKLTDDVELQEDKPKCGVFKPPEELIQKLKQEFEKSDQAVDTNIDSTLQNSENIVDPQQEDGEKEEEVLSFETILDRLFILQDASSAISVDSLEELREKEVESENEVIKLFKILVQEYCKDLSITDWDYVVRCLYKWIGWLSSSNQPLYELYQVEFSVRILDFINQLILMAKNLKNVDNLNEEFPMMQSILDDWNNFHSSNMFQDLVVLFFKLVSIENSGKHTDSVRPLIESLAHIVIGVDPRVVLSNGDLSTYLETKVEFDPESEPPINSIYCGVDEKRFKGFFAMCSLMKRSNCREILITAHHMMRKTIKSVCESGQISTIITDEQEQVEDVPVFPPAALMSILMSRDTMMSLLLSDYRVGDISVTMEPKSDSYACTLAYLFAWDLIIEYIVTVDKELTHRIIHSLKKLGLIQRLLDNVFMLLPPLGERDSLNLRSAASRSSLSNFLKQPLETTVNRPVNEIELVALHLYFSAAFHMPVTVRKWYNNNSNKKLCNLVNEYTVKHISQVICSLEMESVLEKCQERATIDELNNLMIKARPSAKEVYAIYTRDEFKMELTIKLPLNYPLGPVQIDGGKRVGVTDVKWRSWLLRLTTFLSHQNGPLLDGIDLWRKNIDKRFEGIEKCTICFSILHSNYQLPKKRCQTCANMFHNLCLFKWFQSSGNSTCPLCRNAW